MAIEIDQMFEAGVHYGYSRTRRHPTTIPYIFTTKNRVDIIDLEKTTEQLERAKAFLSAAKAQGKVILFVGVKPEAQKPNTDIALALGMPYVSERWVGGSITNWTEIKRRIAELVSLKEQKANGELEKYTKKERLLIDRKVEKMEKNFAGLVGLTRVPDIAIVIDPKREHIAVSELLKHGIPVVALANTDCNISNITYPIIGNDGSVASITAILTELATVLRSE